MKYLVKFIAVIFIIALATRVITNRGNNCKTAIDIKQTTVVENTDSTKNIAKYLDI
jgi:hypothetical protein